MNAVAPWSGKGGCLVISVFLLVYRITEHTYTKTLPIGYFTKSSDLSNSMFDLKWIPFWSNYWFLFSCAKLYHLEYFGADIFSLLPYLSNTDMIFL